MGGYGPGARVTDFCQSDRFSSLVTIFVTSDENSSRGFRVWYHTPLVMAYRRRHSLKHRHREGLRAILAGSSVPRAAQVAGLATSTMHEVIRSPAGRAFLDAERDRIDAHRTLLAASMPQIALLHGLADSARISENVREIGNLQDSETNKRHIRRVQEGEQGRKRATMPQETPGHSSGE